MKTKQNLKRKTRKTRKIRKFKGGVISPQLFPVNIQATKNKFYEFVSERKSTREVNNILNKHGIQTKLDVYNYLRTIPISEKVIFENAYDEFIANE
jgi:hypothetical protein